ncbi:unnamed protein product [Ascophyllum nodosum]
MADQAEDDTGEWSVIWTTAAFAALQGVIVYALFECWRNKESMRGIYQPRQINRPHRTPEEPSSKPFSWLTTILRINEEDTYRMVGMDHYVLLRHCKFGFRLTFYTSILAAVLMAVVYRSGGEEEKEYNEITMANIMPESFRLWFSVVFMYVVVLWALTLMWIEWKNFVPKRFEFLSQGDPDMDPEVSYAVLVENIPDAQRSSPALYGYFDALFPGKVSYASLCMHADDLEEKLAEVQEALGKIEHAVAQKHLDPPKDDETRIGGFLCCGGEKWDTEEYYRRELPKLVKDAGREHSRISEIASQGPGSSVASSTGFVVFTSIATKLAASGLNLSGKHREMDASAAPAPGDVIWDNVTVPATQIALKRIIANCLWMVGILFWAIPVVFVLSIADLNEISKQFTWLWVPESGSFLHGIISGLLPVVALAVLTSLVPLVIRFTAMKFIRFKSEAEVDIYTFKWHFGFRVANLWLIIIGGSIINRVDDFIDDPSSIVELLGSSVPTKSQFFTSTLLVSLFAGLSKDICRIIPVLIYGVTGALSNERGMSDRKLRNAQAAPSLNWSIFYPPLLFVLLVVYCYATIAPLVLPIACLLYWGSYVVYKNQALYVYVQTADTGGEMMFLLHTYMMGSLYVGLVVFIAYIGIKQGAEQWALAVILLLITILWHIVVHKKFVKLSRIQCVEAAVSADKKITKTSGREGRSHSPEHPFDDKAYVQKCLKNEWGDNARAVATPPTIRSP